MPPAIFAAIGFGAIAASIASFAVSIVLSIGLSMLQRALIKKPKPKGTQPDVKVTVRQPAAAWRVVYGQTRVGGTYAFVHTTNNNKYLHLVIMLAGHEVEEIGDIWFDDEVVPLDTSGDATGKYENRVRVAKALGTTDQVAFSDLVAEAGDKWTTAHRLRGRAAIYVRLQFDTNKFPNGVPNISAIVKGKKVYDPRTDTTYWTDNWALCLADYLNNPGYGMGAAYGDEIAADDLIAAANIADEEVDVAGDESPPQTQARYTVNGAFDTDRKPIDVLEDLENAGAGKVFHAGGRWRIKAGAWYPPTITFDENDLRGPLKVQTLLSRRDNFNAVKGTYSSPDNNYQETDFPAIVSAAFQAADGGERVYADISLPFTQTASAAQRLAKIALLKARQPITVDRAPFGLAAYRVQCGDTIGLDNSRFAWSAKAFEIEMATLEIGGSDDGAPLLGVNMVLRESDASVYDWSTSEEQTVDPAPNTDFPDPFNVEPPSSLTLESGGDVLLLLNEGSVISRIRVTWTPPEDAFVVQYDIAWKKSTEAVWNSQIFGAGLDEWFIAPVEDSVAYDVRLRTINIQGAASDWIEQDGHTVIGKTDPPPVPESFTVSRQPDGTRRFAWSLADVPPDVRAGGGYQIRWKVGAETDWTAMAQLHTGLLGNSPYETNELAAGTYTFAIKSIDSSGNESASALFINGVVLGDPRLLGVIYTQREEDALWPGTLTDCFIDSDNVLRALVNGGWDSLASTWSALADRWADLGTGESPIIYETEVIDLSADLTFTPLVTAVVTGSATLSMKTGTTADGNVTGAYGAIGTQSGKRYVQFKVEVTDNDAEIFSFSILIDGQSKVEEFNDVNTATETATWFESVVAGHFKIGSRGELAAITQARLTLQSTGPGWSWELLSKAATVDSEVAAEFKVYDETDTLADAVVDIELRGPLKA
jgi:hypothetical protein